MTVTYELGQTLAGLEGYLKYIRCLVCGAVSHNPNDVEQLYCGRCHEFHEVMMLQEQASPDNPAVIALDMVKRGAVPWADGHPVNLESFERAAAYLDEPVLVLALPPWWLLGLALGAAIAGLALVFSK